MSKQLPEHVLHTVKIDVSSIKSCIMHMSANGKLFKYPQELLYQIFQLFRRFALLMLVSNLKGEHIILFH